MNACNSNSLDSVTIVSKNKNLEKGNDNTFPRKDPGQFSDHPTTEGSCQSEDDGFTASSVSSGSVQGSLASESYPDFGFRVVKHGRSKSNFDFHFIAEAPANNSIKCNNCTHKYSVPGGDSIFMCPIANGYDALASDSFETALTVSDI